MTRYAIGVDLGGTNLKTVAVSASGELLASSTERTTDAADAWVETVRRSAAALGASEHGPASAIGIAAPGLAAKDGRSIAWMRGRMDALEGLDWTERLGSERPVPVLNDAHAALLGEAWVGAAAGCRDAIMLTLGTGVGGAVLVDGRILRGHIGRGGHLGHITLDPEGEPDIVGTPGSLEDAIGDCTVEPRSGGRFDSTRRLVDAALAGDRDAEAVWLRSVHRLACAIVSLVNVTDPEVVVLGGGIAAAGAALFDPLRERMDRMEWRPLGSGVRVVPARLGEYSGAIGAAYHALNPTPRDPT